MACSSVPIALGLAGLSKPTWLSLICRKFNPAGSAAIASPMMPTERGTPPAMVHSTPVPAHVMHSSTRRRLTPRSRPSEVKSLMGLSCWVAVAERIERGDRLFPRIFVGGRYGSRDGRCLKRKRKKPRGFAPGPFGHADVIDHHRPCSDSRLSWKRMFGSGSVLPELPGSRPALPIDAFALSAAGESVRTRRPPPEGTLA